MSKDGKEIRKDKFNEEGTFMVFSINEIHSPNEEVETTVRELTFLKDMGVISAQCIIPKTIINSMKKYHTFEFLKDMI